MAELNSSWVIDSHCHMWRAEDVVGVIDNKFKPLLDTYGPGELRAASSKVGLEACVLIESGTTDQDNQRAADLAASSNLIGAFVTFADLEDDTLDEKLEMWQQHPKFRGVRMRF